MTARDAADVAVPAAAWGDADEKVAGGWEGAGGPSMTRPPAT